MTAGTKKRPVSLRVRQNLRLQERHPEARGPEDSAQALGPPAPFRPLPTRLGKGSVLNSLRGHAHRPQGQSLLTN